MIKTTILAACAAASLIVGAASARPAPPSPPPPMDMSGILPDPQPDVQTDPAVIRGNQAFVYAVLKRIREQQIVARCVASSDHHDDRETRGCPYVRDQWGNVSYVR